jgi:AraC-like DNA-binding protein
MVKLDSEERSGIEFGLMSQRVVARIRSQPHRHQEVELNFIEQGALTYLFGGRQIALQAGNLAVFWAAIPHRIVSIDDSTILHWLTVPLAFFLQWQAPEPFTRQLLSGNLVVEARPANSEIDLAFFERWRGDLAVTSVERRKALLLEVEARLRRLALATETYPQPFEAHPPDEPAEAGFQQAKQMARFIAEHYTRLVSVTQVAEAVKLHPNYAMTLFRKYFGVTILDYLTQYRVAHAQRLLLVSDKPVSQIALEAGFGSVSQFYTVFKQACGQPPKQYRAAFRLV